MTRHPKSPDLPLYGMPKAILGPSARSIAAELRAVALAIRLFGLDALPAVMARSRQAEAGEQPDLFNTGDE